MFEILKIMCLHLRSTIYFKKKGVRFSVKFSLNFSMEKIIFYCNVSKTGVGRVDGFFFPFINNKNDRIDGI